MEDVEKLMMSTQLFKYNFLFAKNKWHRFKDNAFILRTGGEVGHFKGFS